MYTYILMFVFNMFSVYLFLFRSKLFYWLMEGYVPWIWIILSFLLVLFIPLVGNITFAIKSKKNWWKVLLFAFLSILILIVDPFIMPKYIIWVTDYTMHLSFSILEFFKTQLLN
ncbi:hypothetical protein QFZ81_002976 [Paenibacillus sp. V4I9]|nr:hypothetical protein [Paenibacillus sp. V4I9]